jgi:hypothetical protein
MNGRRGEYAGDDGSNLQGFHQQTPLGGAIKKPQFRQRMLQGG